MCDPVTLGIAALSVATVGTGASIIGGANAASAQKSAAAQAEQQASATQAANERAINQANQQGPNLQSILASNRSLATSGVGSTMLSGPGGVQNSSLSLGRNTLLGQ